MANPKPIFLFAFAPAEVTQLMQFQLVANRDNVLRNMAELQRFIMNEALQRRPRAESQVQILAQAAAISSKNQTTQTKSGPESETKKTYVITYYNPETHKAEVLETKNEIKINDNAKQAIEESLGMLSVYPLYNYIGAPLMKQEVLPWKLEQILAEREYATPPPSSGAAPVIPVARIVQTEAEVAAVKKKDEEVRAAVSVAIVRKEETELKLGQEIMLLDDTVAALRKGEEIDKVIERLPPLSRARYVLALRRKQLNRQTVVNLLMRDAGFLKTVKKKLETFSLDDLANMVRMLRSLRQKK